MSRYAFVIAGLLCPSFALQAGDSDKRTSAQIVPLANTTITNLVATPASLTISGTDPDLGPLQSLPTNVSWTIQGGNRPQGWTLTVNPVSGGFSGCPNVPLAAVRLTCQSVVAAGGAGGLCSQPFLLSAGSHTVAFGVQGNNTRSYQVNLSLDFTDSWRYSATGATRCSVDLSYTVTTY